MSYANVKITTWGVKIDIQGLVFVAAMTALGFVINTMVIPIAPSLWLKFGSLVGRFVGVCNGPLWSMLSTMVSVAYVGIVIHGDLPGIFAAGIGGGLWGSIVDKYFHPMIGIFPSIPGGFIMYYSNVFISGYPVALAAQVFLKRILSTAIIAPAFTVLIAIPGIWKYMPLEYDSWVVRWWLLKMDEEYAEESE
ncbi:MAG: hypothetical protein ACW976_06695 [Candidatus Ranarchaeia archaeon]|jgi:hypothetical protein